ncbi:MAG: hypothetical protein QOI63_173 [Thermoplasmata archaeon]|jgi:hypothetical protein|nr:hypothetical protein [Thermoplasmata archaeon]
MAGARYADAKEFHGQEYHGMKVGGVHRWDYPDGVWEERKVDPGRWQVSFRSLKRRKSTAPRGSGAGVGSGYHWLIVAHQWAKKLDANTYATLLEGDKYLVAFRKPDWGKWNTQFRHQKGARAKAIKCLQDSLARLESGSGDLEDPRGKAALARLEAAATEIAARDRPPRPSRRKDVRPSPTEPRNPRKPRKTVQPKRFLEFRGFRGLLVRRSAGPRRPSRGIHGNRGRRFQPKRFLEFRGFRGPLVRRSAGAW